MAIEMCNIWWKHAVSHYLDEISKCFSLIASRFCLSERNISTVRWVVLFTWRKSELRNPFQCYHIIFNWRLAFSIIPGDSFSCLMISCITFFIANHKLFHLNRVQLVIFTVTYQVRNMIQIIFNVWFDYFEHIGFSHII